MKERNIFEGMVFQSPAVNKQEYISMYPEYVRRCSAVYKRLDLRKIQIEYRMKQQRKRLMIISSVVGTLAVIISVIALLIALSR